MGCMFFYLFIYDLLKRGMEVRCRKCIISEEIEEKWLDLSWDMCAWSIWLQSFLSNSRRKHLMQFFTLHLNQKC